MKVLERLKKTLECNTQEEDNCSCRCCSGSDCSCQSEENKNEKFVLKENLSDEEIEEIIETEYKDKNGYEKKQIKRALRIFGNKYSYHKTEFRYMKIEDKKMISKDTDKLITVTCFEHGDFTIKRSIFFKIGCSECFLEEKNNSELADNILELFLYKDFPNTREYLKKNYIFNALKGIATSVILKEDFIALAESVRNDLDLFDFSCVPDIIMNSKTKFLIKFNDPNVNMSGDWTTDMHHFIARKQTPKNLKGKYLGIERSEKIAERVISDLEGTYPNLDFSNSTYRGMHQPIEFRCKVHGTELTYASVHSMLKKDSVSGFKGCPDCLKEYRDSQEGTPSTKTTEQFIADCERVYGVGTFDYSLVKYKRWDIPVEIIDIEFNEVFSIRPSYFLKGKGSPFKYESGGEALVRRSLEKIKENNIHNLIIEKEKAITNKIEGRNTNMVIIDYICHIDSTEIWIEYNGQQHYNPYYYKQFENWETLYEKQLKRDVNLRNYCRDNKIMLIEIPYTYNNKDTVYEILYDILVNNKKPEDSIITPKIEEI